MTRSHDPLLLTKLFIPVPRQTEVPRPRLIEALDAGFTGRLTVVCAPAGFGKSTLLSGWVAASEQPVAWVSLDETDSQPIRFLTYVITALRTVAPAVGEGYQEALPSGLEPVLADLVNDLSALTAPLILVLDDYHAVDDAAVDDMVRFLIEHLPPQVHLVISTRQDPNLPLARLRARGQLTELRAADLRFTPTEVTTYLTSVMGLALTVENIATLERRTEGWIAGLQLAALSLRGHQDVGAFIEGFAGDNRFIADYLVGEVLGRQPAEVRSFLLQTAILDRLSGPLCDAVTGQDRGSARLEALERGNFFLVPLDDRRQWYRYHHLFAEVLRAYLAEELPDQLPVLHRRAAQWYETTGSLPDAIGHLLAAGDDERVADLVEAAAPALSQARQEATLLSWLQAIPEKVLSNRPVLNASYAGVLMSSGLMATVESRLDDAARWLEPSADQDEMVVIDQDSFRRLPGSIAMWRAGARLVSGDPAGCEQRAKQAIALSAADDHLTQGGASALIGLVAWGTGDLEEALTRYTECIAHLTSEGSFADVVGCSITLADIRITQGRLRDAEAIYQRGLQLATSASRSVLRGAADMEVGLAGVHFERGDLDRAREHLARAEELGSALGLPQHPYRSRVVAAQLRQCEGDHVAAVALLNEAERLYDNDFSPKVRPVAALRARTWLAQGNAEDAARWAREQGLTADDELSYLREFEHITLARLLLAQRELSAAASLLDRLLHAAEAGGRAGSVLEILVLQALTHQSRGGAVAAQQTLRRALVLGEPDGYVRSFLDEGPQIVTLLQELDRQGIALSYVRMLLAVGRTAIPSLKQPLIDPLSERELDVLRLLGSELSGPEIAQELVVSLHTVRSHTKSIYGKLGVNSRRAAVREAELLQLLPRPVTGRP